MHIVCPECDTINRVEPIRLRDYPKCGSCHQPLFSKQALELTGGNFVRHSNRNDIPLLIDFWAPWCGPCRTMAPAFAEATAGLEPDFRLGKLNTENESAIASKFDIRSIPTLLILLHGKELGRRSGAVSTAEIVRWATDTMRT